LRIVHALVPRRSEETARHQAPIVRACVEPHVDGYGVDALGCAALEERAEPPRRARRVVEPTRPRAARNAAAPGGSRQEREPREGQRQGEREQDRPDDSWPVMTFVVLRR
jgi:hypothetical protein